MLDNISIGVHFNVVEEYAEKLWRINKTSSQESKMSIYIFPVDLTLMGSEFQSGGVTNEKAILFISFKKTFVSTLGTKK